MRKAAMALAAAVVLSGTMTTVPTPAHADGGRITAGVVGGLAAGALLGAAIAGPRPYYAPAPVYVEPAPVYVAPPPPPVRCYWSRGEPVWDEWRGAWVRPRVQVCD